MSFFKKIAVLVGSGLSLLAVAIPVAMAQDQNQGGGSGLLVSPTRSEISAQPGESKKFTITLRNVTQGDVTARAFINDFESDNVSGTPRFIVEEGVRTPNSIKDMVKGLKDVELKKDEIKEVNLSVDLDPSIPPGAYYGAVRFAAVPKIDAGSEAERQVALTASVAHLVFVEVAGEVTEQIQVESLKMGRDNSTSSIFFKSPSQSSLGIKNLGNGFSRPFGSVTINDFKNKEVFRYDVNDTDPKGIILPNSSRTFINDVQNIKTPGRYTATAAVAYGNGGEVVTYKSTFWYFPAWFVAIVALLLVLVIVGSYYAYKKQYGSSATKKKRNRK